MTMDIDLTTMAARDFLKRRRGNPTEEDGQAECCDVHSGKEGA